MKEGYCMVDPRKQPGKADMKKTSAVNCDNIFF